MDRIDRASRRIAADPTRIYHALVDPVAVAAWLPPRGMTGRVEVFDVRPGGAFRIVLRHDSPDGAPGKSTPDTDIVTGTFRDIVPGRRLVQGITFVTGDPDLAPGMTMTWLLTPVADGTRVEVVAGGVPRGIDPDEHEAGMASSLANLDAYLSAGTDSGGVGR